MTDAIGLHSHLDDKNPGDRLVADYLDRLSEATVGLDATHRVDLIGQIRAHIAEARAASPTDDEHSVRDVLHRLGEPDTIALAAYQQDRQPATRSRALSPLAYDWITIGLLSLGSGFVPIVGWFAGLVMLWRGPRWTLRDRLLGTLIWPLGIIGPLLIGRAIVRLVPPHPYCLRGVCGLMYERPWVYLLAPFTDPSLAPLFGLVGVLAVGGYLAVRAHRHASRTAR